MQRWLNKIICGDCLEIMKQMPDKCVDLMLTDPPYLIGYATNHRKDKDHVFCNAIMNDNNPELVSAVIRESSRLLKDDSAAYWFCSWDKSDWFKKELERHLKVKNMIVWVKNNWTAGDLEAQFGKQYELIFLANKGRCKINGKRLSDVWDFRRVVGEKQFHQNQKPTNLIRRCIEKHSDLGGVILDPFLGSGTTAIAAVQLGRNFIGIEISPEYCRIAEERLKCETAQMNMFSKVPHKGQRPTADVDGADRIHHLRGS